MKFYNSVGPNPQVVRIFAAERGIALDMEIGRASCRERVSKQV